MKKISLYLMLVAGIAPAAYAEHGGACEADMKKLCGTVQPGEGRIIRCMQENEANLSAACKEQVAKKKGMAATAGKAQGEWPCKADAEKLCAGVQPGEGRIINCLKSKESELSAGCKEKLPTMKPMMKDGK